MLQHVYNTFFYFFTSAISGKQQSALLNFSTREIFSVKRDEAFDRPFIHHNGVLMECCPVRNNILILGKRFIDDYHSQVQQVLFLIGYHK